MRLSDVLARRGSLAPPEVVTLVVGLAMEIDAGHVRGRICAESVRFDPDGRPRLCAGPGRSASAVSDLAALGLRALGDQLAPRLVEALHVGPADDARTLAERVLASGPAAPLRLPFPQDHREIEPIERAKTTSSRLRPVLALGALVLFGAISLVIAFVRRQPERWVDIVAGLDRARSAAISDRDSFALTAVYAPGSSQLTRDIALIRSLARRGLTLRGRLAELTDPTVLGTATLAAVEQPASYVLVDRRGRVVLRVDGGAPRRVVVHLRHTSAGWRVVSVR